MRAVCGQQAAEWDKNRKITQCGITEQNRSSSSKVLYYAKTLALTILHRVTAWLAHRPRAPGGCAYGLDLSGSG